MTNAGCQLSIFDKKRGDSNKGWIKRLAVMLAVCAAVGLCDPSWGGEKKILSLDECIETAMAHNHRRPVSRFAVAAAEAQHRQALSGYWPHITLKTAYELMDEPRNYIFPERAFILPPSSLQTPQSSVTVPVNAFGPGFPSQNVEMPVDSQTIDIPGAQFNLSEQDIKLHDEESWFASVEARWLLWDGGFRRGKVERAKAGVEVARQALRRTDLEVIDSVKRMYYGAVMAGQVRQVGEDTLARMVVTLDLTEMMYKEGAGRVKKTDYLENKVMVETLRSAVALLEKNQTMAEAALAYTIGLAWDDTVHPKDETIPFIPNEADLKALVGDAYVFSPDWKRIEAGIQTAKGSLREAKSGHWPRLALVGNLHRWWNDYDKGYATEDNKEGWTVRVGVEIPVFSGFLTQNKIREARARLQKIEEERFLLKEGIGLQVRNIVLGLGAADARYQATLNAMTSAEENRSLNTRAYQNDLVETEDVIRAQLMEAFMSAQHYKVCYDRAELMSRLNLVVGTEISQQLDRGAHNLGCASR